MVNLNENDDGFICYLCKVKCTYDIHSGYYPPEDFESTEELVFCFNCFKSNNCDSCGSDVNNPDELIYLIKKYNNINTCIICLLEQYENIKHCQCCKCLEKNKNIKNTDNIDIKSSEEYKHGISSLDSDNIKIIKEKKNKSNPKKSDRLKNNDIVFNKSKKVTLNNCLYNRFKKEYDNKIELLKINAKNKLLFHIKKTSKKIIIAKRFIKELTIKKEFNLQIKNLFNKIKYNIDKKINIKIINPNNKFESLFQINIESKYNEIDSQSKLGGLFIKENIENKNDIKKYIKLNDNLYLNSLLNNENRISRYIEFSKRLYKLNKYVNIDTIIYCKFLNDIRDVSYDVFEKLINKVDKYMKNKGKHNISNTISTNKVYKFVF